MKHTGLCWLILAVTPASVMAANPGMAMLYSHGTAYVNGAEVPGTTLIFPGDRIETNPESIAYVNSRGSAVMIFAKSSVRCEKNVLSVERGAVVVITSTATVTQIGDVTVKPVSGAQTDFQVSVLDEQVEIAANKGDISVSDSSGTTTLAAGQRTSRNTSKHSKGGGASPSARGGLLDSMPVVVGGSAAIGALAVWVASQDSQAASPSVP